MPRTPLVRFAWIAGLVLAGCSDTGTKTYSPAEVQIQKVAFSGKPLTVWYFYSVTPDCKQSGSVLVEITKPPRNGSVEVQHNVEHYPEYPVSNSRYRCNTEKVASEAVTYTSRSGFLGTDVFSVRTLYPSSGDVSVRAFKISVENPPKQ